MKFHEYQTKQLFAEAGIPIPKGVLIRSLQDLPAALKTLGSETCVIKAQVLAGGRGKAGGIQFANSLSEAQSKAAQLLGKKLSTLQTGTQGETINSLYVEGKANIDRMLYLGMVLDREQRAVTIIYSTEGGMDVEEVAADHPEKILTFTVPPLAGYYPFIGREIARKLGVGNDLMATFSTVVGKLYDLFCKTDASLLEINPLILTKEKQILALDGKLVTDDNGNYRQKRLVEVYKADNLSAEDPQELQAKEIGVSYVSLDGNIGCMVNGAGLAMATMDIIKLAGGEPANFLDVGGGANAQQIRDAFKLILNDKRVKGILVNIFGGIVRCDLVAQGIVNAAKELSIAVPVVVRLQGTNVNEGKAILKSSGLNLSPAENMDEAAELIVSQVKKGK